MTDDARPFSGGRRALWIAGGILILGAALTAFSARSLHGFLVAYLAAYNFAISTVLGAFGLLLIVNAMKAEWPVAIRRLLEALVAPIPLLAILFLPILAGLAALYPWIRPETIADERERALVAAKAAYLSAPFFVLRTGAYFVVWIVLRHLLSRWSTRQDRSPSPRAEGRMYAASAVSLPLFAITLSFASFDWLMSLTPAWFSSLFPVYYFAGGFVSALACLTLLAAAAHRTGWIRGLNDSHFHALGRLLLAFVIFWAYAAFFQLLLIWIANEPDETGFYLVRLRGGFRTESLVLAVTQFVIPFAVLLNHDLKRRPTALALVAAWIVAAHYLDVHWLVVPSARPAGPVLATADIGALLAVGGAVTAYVILWLRGRPLVPVHDSRLEGARRYDST